MLLALALVAALVPQEPAVLPATPSLYDLELRALDGKPFDAAALRGKVALVVNVASRCGYTPQYAGLQELHDELAPKGFVVLGIPSNDFGGQEPGTPDEIRAFCTERYSVTFPLLEKAQVKGGDGQSRVYALLHELTGELPSWNFGKYVVARDGRSARFFGTKVAPDDAGLRKAIDDALAAPMALSGVLSEAEFAAQHDLREDAAPALRGSAVEVAGTKMYLSLPQGAAAPLPALVVIHEFWGLNDHVKHWADRLAADGYAALAVDLYGGFVAKDRDAAANAMRSVDAAKARQTLLAAVAFLQQDPRVAAKQIGSIGWCFGGAWSLQLAIASEELDAAVIYYGRLIHDPAQLRAIRAPVLGIFADRDRGIPPASVDAFEAAMREAGRDLRVLRYDADHAFANPSGARYDRKHAAAAWQQAQAFLAKHLKPKR
jgi:carboxymethylenebutenolidase